jgi:hypothetical protein
MSQVDLSHELVGLSGERFRPALEDPHRPTQGLECHFHLMERRQNDLEDSFSGSVDLDRFLDLDCQPYSKDPKLSRANLKLIDHKYLCNTCIHQIWSEVCECVSARRLPMIRQFHPAQQSVLKISLQ